MVVEPFIGVRVVVFLVILPFWDLVLWSRTRSEVRFPVFVIGRMVLLVSYGQSPPTEMNDQLTPIFVLVSIIPFVVILPFMIILVIIFVLFTPVLPPSESALGRSS